MANAVTNPVAMHPAMQIARVMASARRTVTGPATASAGTNHAATHPAKARVLPAMHRAPKVAPVPRPAVPAMANSPAIPNAAATVSAATNPAAMRPAKARVLMAARAVSVLRAMALAPKASAVRIPKASQT